MKRAGRRALVWLGCLAVGLAAGQLRVSAAEHVYTIQWPYESSLQGSTTPADGSVQIHYLLEQPDGSLTPLDVGTKNNIQSTGVASNNRKGIGTDGVGASGAGGDGPFQISGNVYGFDLRILVGGSEDAENGLYYNPAFEHLEYRRAYVPENSGETAIQPYLYSQTRNNTTLYGYFSHWPPDAASLGTEDFWTNAGGQDIYLVYGEKRTVPTEIPNDVTELETGFRMYLFDYAGSGSSDGMWGNDTWVPTGTANGDTTGHYSKTLEPGGFPTYRNGNSTADLARYFDPGYEGNRVSHNGGNAITYIGKVDGLLQDDGSGKYFYDSAQNAAWLDRSTNTFHLYEEVVTTGDYERPDRFVGNLAFKRGNFLPFNPMDRTTVWATSNDDGKLGRPVYAAEGTVNYHFGMYMEGTFFQPEVGARPTFYIRGDDDILVYIDDVLVLDLGGIHDPLEGAIYFGAGDEHGAGTVVYQKADGKTYTDTLKNLLNGRGHVYNSGRTLSDEDFTGDTLKSNTIHTIRVFYAERGAGASNLRIEVNAPDPSLTITNSFWLDEDASDVEMEEKFVPFDRFDHDSIAKARYMLQELQTVEGVTEAQFRLRYVETEGEQTGNRDPVSYSRFVNGSYTFQNLNQRYTYYVEILKNGKVVATSDPIFPSLGEVQITVDETISADNVAIDVQYVLGADLEPLTPEEKAKLHFTPPWVTAAYNGNLVAGDHMFTGLDFDKRYQVVQQLYYDDINGHHISADGSTDVYGYEFTSVFVDNLPQLKDPDDNKSHRQATYVVTNPFTLLTPDSNELVYPEIVFRNVYGNVDIGKSILVNGTRQKLTTAAQGDTVTYELLVDLLNYLNYDTSQVDVVFALLDKPDPGLEIDPDTVQVQYRDSGAETGAPYKTMPRGDFAAQVDADGVLTIRLNAPKSYSGDRLRVTYNAVVRQAPANGLFLKNALHASYTNGADGSVADTEILNTYVYSFGFDVMKTDEAGMPLSGAEFTLTDDSGAVTAVSGRDGYAHFTGLDVGTYTLTETKAPSGYLAGERAHTVTISASFDPDGVRISSYTVTFDLGTGQQISHTLHARYDENGGLSYNRDPAVIAYVNQVDENGPQGPSLDAPPSPSPGDPPDQEPSPSPNGPPDAPESPGVPPDGGTGAPVENPPHTADEGGVKAWLTLTLLSLLGMAAITVVPHRKTP